jgi:hypothetical protein
MPRPVSAASRPRPRAIAAAWLLLVLAATGCGTGGLPATAPPAPTPAASATAAPPSRPAPSPTPGSPDPGGASPSTALGTPPAATLSSAGSGAADGALGSFTWDGAGTDAPWIVPAVEGRTRTDATLRVAFEPSIEPESWTARWAPVTAGGAGDVVSGIDGAGPVVVNAPADAGVWSLQLEASFGRGRGGAWYWRLEVAP